MLVDSECSHMSINNWWVWRRNPYAQGDLKTWKMFLPSFSKFLVLLLSIERDIIWLNINHYSWSWSASEHYQARRSPQQLTLASSPTVSVWGAAPTLTFPSRETLLDSVSTPNTQPRWFLLLRKMMRTWVFLFISHRKVMSDGEPIKQLARSSN